MHLQLSLTIAILASIPASLCVVTTVGDLAVLEGGSVAVPCHYGPEYAGYVKYWCSGRLREVCTSLARTDAPPPTSGAGGEKVSIFDDPVQQVFTVTMRDLKESDSGWYWCGVEVGGIWSADVAASLHISVVHGMSVVNSRLSGEEGDSITVECQYSEKYRASEKKWCRSGDWSSCVVTGPEGSYEDAALRISDDRRGMFSVTLRGLRMRDAGWYWCSAEQQQVAVHLMVNPRESTTAVSTTTTTTTTTTPTPTPTPTPTTTTTATLRTTRLHTSTQTTTQVPTRKATDRSLDYHRHFLSSPLQVCAAVVVLMGLVMLTLKVWGHYKKAHRRRQAEKLKARFSSPQHQDQADGGDWQSSSVVFLNPAS